MSGIVTGLFHGFVTSGGATQSAANDRAGAKTQVSSLVLSALSLLTVFAFLPLIADLPLATLAAIVISAVSGFLDVPALRRMRQVQLGSFIIALIALAGVLVAGILPGLVLAITLSILLLLGRLSRPRASELAMPAALPAGGAPRPAAAVEPTERAQPDGLLVVRPEGPLLFINALWISDEVKARIAARRSPSVLVLDLEESSTIDFTSLEALADLQDQLRAQGVELWLSNVHEEVQGTLDRAGDAHLDGSPRVFSNNEAAAAAFVKQQ